MNELQKIENIAEEGLEELMGKHKKSYYKKVLFWLLGIFLLVLIVLGVIYFVYWQPLKNSFVLANEAQTHFEQAQTALLGTDFPKAKSEIEKTQANLAELETNVDKLDSPLMFGYLRNQYTGVKTIVEAVQEFSQGLYLITNLAHDTLFEIKLDKNGNLSLTPEKRIEILTKIAQSAPELNGAKAQLDLSLLTLNQIDTQKLNPSLLKYHLTLKAKISLLQNFLTQASGLAETLPKILGLGEEKTYLFLLQNSDELRPTGGFIGTIGILKLKNGQIVSFKTNDVYDYDRFAINKKMKVTAPEPIKKYLVENWYLRDSNWSPDFPTAAEKIEWFYHTEAELSKGELPNEKIDGVIAITPKLIEDLMATLGAVEVDSFIFNKENFVDQLQYLVEVGVEKQNVPYFARKNIIGTLSQKLIARLDNLNFNGWLEVFKTLFNNLNEKNILIYNKDAQIQNLITKQNWSGAIKETSGDFLMVVDANLAALKSNQCVERNISYTINPEADKLKAKTTITYKNNCTFTWKSTRYRTYTRVYVPLGSEWIKTEGSMDNDRSPKKGWTDISQENNKTVFGTFIAIEPGESGTLAIEYYLPENVNPEISKQVDSSVYKLYLQKQPGLTTAFSLDLKFDHKIINSTPTNKNTLSNTRYQIYGDMLIDREVQLEF